MATFPLGGKNIVFSLVSRGDVTEISGGIIGFSYKLTLISCSVVLKKGSEGLNEREKFLNYEQGAFSSPVLLHSHKTAHSPLKETTMGVCYLSKDEN